MGIGGLGWDQNFVILFGSMEFGDSIWLSGVRRFEWCRWSSGFGDSTRVFGIRRLDVSQWSSANRLGGWWTGQVEFCASVGVRGFRCLDVCRWNSATWCERISVSRLCVAGIRRLDVGSRISANRLGAVDFGDWVISAIRFSLVELSDKNCVFVFSPGAPSYT